MAAPNNCAACRPFQSTDQKQALASVVQELSQLWNNPEALEEVIATWRDVKDFPLFLHIAVATNESHNVRLFSLFFPEWLDDNYKDYGTALNIAQKCTCDNDHKSLILHFLKRPFVESDTLRMKIWLEVSRELFLSNLLCNWHQAQQSKGTCHFTCKIHGTDSRCLPGKHVCTV